jgi:hypothetical protein
MERMKNKYLKFELFRKFDLEFFNSLFESFDGAVPLYLPLSA